MELDEVLIFAYRSKGLREMMEPFPSSDARIFEELIIFQSQEHQTRHLEMADKSMKKQIRLSPDPLSASSRGRTAAAKKKRLERPWKQPVILTKSRAYLIWTVFATLERDALVQCGDLLEPISDDRRLRGILDSGGHLLRQDGLLEDRPEC